MAKILVADDSIVMREMVKTLLEIEGHMVIGEAKDGVEAVEKYKELRPDVTTLDITMPVMNGLQALKEIMEFDSAAHVIMVSASRQNIHVSEALILGACEFLHKPLDKKELSEAISRVTTRKPDSDFLF